MTRVYICQYEGFAYIPTPRAEPIPAPRARPVPIPRKIMSKLRPTPPPRTKRTKPAPPPRTKNAKPVPPPRVRPPPKECEHGTTEEIDGSIFCIHYCGLEETDHQPYREESRGDKALRGLSF